ncbi:Na(+)-translocating NADH-quinone reductase subunit F [Hanstruepera neustonica]|uniref:Na(+)-translocating NADH-quinone reductase subunit F n=1 Tax=Hanstruepera neustonica TaxID=1445657 RepID=A0A2K1E4S8_9FLAO|nr:Na(+)-translocating NADH-quinone reductase subunit F [Hanstruepera neustonica]PNQ75288.1 Na(+)-translocating NADH-quinone reductase subunit F [Hanstruepera neustonica]
MTTSKRFESAVKKLYTAFHNNTLHPEDCKQCAVGNILNNQDFWKHLSDDHGSLKLNYVGLVNQKLGKRFNGYSPMELLQIEQAFLKGCGYVLPIHHSHNKPSNPTNSENLFKGLSSVIEILCELDHIPNVMDCSKLFAYQPKKKDLVLN